MNNQFLLQSVCVYVCVCGGGGCARACVRACASVRACVCIVVYELMFALSPCPFFYFFSSEAVYAQFDQLLHH